MNWITDRRRIGHGRQGRRKSSRGAGEADEPDEMADAIARERALAAGCATRPPVVAAAARGDANAVRGAGPAAAPTSRSSGDGTDVGFGASPPVSMTHTTAVSGGGLDTPTSPVMELLLKALPPNRRRRRPVGAGATAASGEAAAVALLPSRTDPNVGSGGGSPPSAARGAATKVVEGCSPRTPATRSRPDPTTAAFGGYLILPTAAPRRRGSTPWTTTPPSQRRLFGRVAAVRALIGARGLVNLHSRGETRWKVANKRGHQGRRRPATRRWLE